MFVFYKIELDEYCDVKNCIKNIEQFIEVNVFISEWPVSLNIKFIYIYIKILMKNKNTYFSCIFLQKIPHSFKCL